VRTAIRVTAAAFASASSAASGAGAGHAVFVQTDNTAGNRVVAYDRAADGKLAPAGSYATGGRGGILAGSVVDHTASQGSLAYDPRHGLLYAVNAGSDTISVFAVHGDQLALRQVLGSGDPVPAASFHVNASAPIAGRTALPVQFAKPAGRYLPEMEPARPSAARWRIPALNSSPGWGKTSRRCRR
jgi:hypothetical protein